jgi:hypothetical protein
MPCVVINNLNSTLMGGRVETAGGGWSHMVNAYREFSAETIPLVVVPYIAYAGIGSNGSIAY